MVARRRRLRLKRGRNSSKKKKVEAQLVKLVFLRSKMTSRPPAAQTGITIY